MKLVVLSDNRSKDALLETEHGLCIYLETSTHKWLLDTGASDLFIRNAEKLNIQLEEVDFVFISHGHADHIGGLISFLDLNSKAKVFLSEYAIIERFFSSRAGKKEIGISLDLEKYGHRLSFIKKNMHIGSDVLIFSDSSDSFPAPEANRMLYSDKGDGIDHDDFKHELFICFGTEELMVYTGCAHKGLLNMLDAIERGTEKPVSKLIGGFHLPDSTESLLFEIEEELSVIGTELQTHYPHTHFITGHCTGSHAFNQLKEKLQERIVWFYTGYSIE
jgi:7,8-dihydropterin-6-yl-methyl-4-(beta-D-ribofuranosyl)aminobenzene 5'-phosphate synthase